jgi:hypothetical protein
VADAGALVGDDAVALEVAGVVGGPADVAEVGDVGEVAGVVAAPPEVAEVVDVAGAEEVEVAEVAAVGAGVGSAVELLHALSSRHMTVAVASRGTRFVAW